MKSNLKPHLLLALVFCLAGSFAAQSQNDIDPHTMSNESPSSHEDGSPVVALENGRQIQSPLPKDNLPATFYYYGGISQPSLVKVNCAGREIII